MKRNTRCSDAGAGSGRQGQPSLAEDILNAAEDVGSDGKGRDGRLGYLKFLAEDYPVQFAGLLDKVVDFEPPRKDPPKIFRTQEEVEAEMKRRGLPIPKGMFS